MHMKEGEGERRERKDEGEEQGQEKKQTSDFIFFIKN